VDECLKGDEIPTTDHVALHCPRIALEWGEDGNPCGLKIDAFRVDDDGISVNWLEYERSSFDECFERTCRLFASALFLRDSHRCAIMKVDEIKQTAAARNKSVKIVHDPVDEPQPNPAHALIIGCAPNDTLLQEFTLLVDLRRFSPAALEISKKREKQKKKNR
jgi:hypothetical protein